MITLALVLTILKWSWLIFIGAFLIGALIFLFILLAIELVVFFT